MCALNYPQAICALSPPLSLSHLQSECGEDLVSFDRETLVDEEKDNSYFRGVPIPV